MKLFSGKRFFVAIIIIILFISALAFAPHFLTWQSAGMPDFSMNDIRKPEFVEPFKKKTNQVSKVTVHGKLWTSEYDDTGSIYLYDQTPIAQIIHANPFEKITLTDGNTIEIEGIEFLPNRKSSNQMLIDSDGKWSNKNQQDPKSDTLVTQQFLPYQIDDQIKINLKLIHDIKINNIHRIGLFDTKTGWIISESIYKNNRVIHQDGVKINHSDNLVILNYIRPSPSAFFIEIAQGNESTMEFKINEGEENQWGDNRCILKEIEREVWFWDNSGSKNATVKESIYTQLTFEGMPTAARSIIAFDTNGNEMTVIRLNLSTNNGGGSISIPGEKKEIDRIEIKYKPEYAKIIVEIPELPINPFLSGDTDNLMKMTLPSNYVVYSESELIHLISSITQTRYGSNPNVPNLFPMHSPISTPPFDFSGWTVEQLLEWVASRNRSKEYLMTDNGHLFYLNAAIAGQTSIQYGAAPTNWMMRWSWKSLYSLGIYSIILVLLLLKTTLLLRAKSLSNFLRPRGYTHFSLWDFEYLVAALGRKAWHLPVRDEIGILPGVDPDQPKQLAAFMKNQMRLK